MDESLCTAKAIVFSIGGRPAKIFLTAAALSDMSCRAELGYTTRLFKYDKPERAGRYAVNCSAMLDRSDIHNLR